MRYLVPVLLFAFTACSEDKPTEPPEPPAPVLDTKANEIKNGTWASADYIVADRKWKLLSISEAGLRVSWVLEFKNSSDKTLNSSVVCKYKLLSLFKLNLSTSFIHLVYFSILASLNPLFCIHCLKAFKDILLKVQHT